MVESWPNRARAPCLIARRRYLSPCIKRGRQPSPTCLPGQGGVRGKVPRGCGRKATKRARLVFASRVLADAMLRASGRRTPDLRQPTGTRGGCHEQREVRTGRPSSRAKRPRRDRTVLASVVRERGLLRLRREGQLEPMLEQLQNEQGASAVWAFGVTCLDPLRSTHHQLPKLIEEASHGFTDAARRLRVRRSFAGAAGGASAIGIRHGLPNAAAFLAGFHLLEACPRRGVAAACAYARLATAFRERERVLGPSRADDRSARARRLARIPVDCRRRRSCA